MGPAGEVVKLHVAPSQKTGQPALSGPQMLPMLALGSTHPQVAVVILEAMRCVPCRERVQRASVAYAKELAYMGHSLCRALPAIKGGYVKYLISTILLAITLSGCYTAGHAGRTTDSGGLESTCAGGCAEYRSDGTGCAKFQKGTSESCSAYFTQICSAAPSQCASK